jgi:PiT family inorganic phosphate transporter
VEEGTLALVVGITFVALVFDFLNGFHDAANSIATVVSTRVLSPRQAVVWAAFFNFVAAFLFDVEVANTIGRGIVNPDSVTVWVLFAGLMGAIVWDIVTWYYGLPTSSSHALIGGLAGAALVHGGPESLVAWGIIKVVIFIFVAPVMGLVLGWVLMVLVYRVFARHHPHKVDHLFRKLQLVSAGLYSLGHGFNDAQKTMGIIAVLLYTTGFLEGGFHVPIWVVLACHAAIALGTLLGGWRIVKTMGMRITHLEPVGGFCAETAGATTLIIASVGGIPVSTTHTITGAIVGVGATRRLSAVRWGVATRIVWAWILTIPASAAIAALTWYLVSLFL